MHIRLNFALPFLERISYFKKITIMEAFFGMSKCTHSLNISRYFEALEPFVKLTINHRIA